LKGNVSGYNSSHFSRLKEGFKIGKYVFRTKKSKLIGCGAWGHVYRGWDVEAKEFVAVKVGTNQAAMELNREYHLYRIMSSNRRTFGLLTFFKFVPHPVKDNVIIMELLGPDIDNVRRKLNFSLKTLIQIGVQMLDRIEMVHSHGIIHGDCHLGNFALGSLTQSPEIRNVIRILDFNRSFPYECTDPLCGHRRKGVHISKGMRSSRADDVGLMFQELYYLLDPDIGEVFKAVSDHAERVPFHEKPDYDYYRSMLYKRFYDQGFVNDNLYDWDDKLDKLM